MNRYQKILNEIFPNRYVIADSWEGMDAEYDRLGIYNIPADQTPLGTPHICILEVGGVWFFEYQWPVDEEGRDYDFVEYPKSGNSCDEIFIRVIEFIATLIAMQYLRNE